MATLKDIKWDQIRYGSEWNEGCGMDRDSESYHLYYGNLKLKDLNNEFHTVTDLQLKQLLNLDCSMKDFRKALWDNNKNLFYQIKMNDELREDAMAIDEKKLKKLKEYELEARWYIRLYEDLAKELYGKCIKFNQYKIIKGVQHDRGY